MPPNDSSSLSYVTFLRDTIQCRVHLMFPDECYAKIETYEMDIDGFRSVVAVPIMEAEDDTWGIPLFKGTAGHATEATSLRALLFIIAQRMAEDRGNPAPNGQRFDLDLQAIFQRTQARETGGTNADGQSSGWRPSDPKGNGVKDA